MTFVSWPAGAFPPNSSSFSSSGSKSSSHSTTRFTPSLFFFSAAESVRPIMVESNAFQQAEVLKVSFDADAKKFFPIYFVVSELERGK